MLIFHMTDAGAPSSKIFRSPCKDQSAENIGRNIKEENCRKLERLYLAYREPMYWGAYKILHDSQLAEDAVAESVIKIMKHIEEIRDEPKSSTKAFMVITCMNTAKDIWRKRFGRCREDAWDDNMEAICGDFNPCDIAVTHEMVERIVAMLKGMDPLMQDIFILRYSHHLKLAEIGEICNLPAEGVKKRLYRIKNILFTSLHEEGWL